MYRLLALDIDGTLINFNQRSVTEKVKESIKEAKKRGVYVTLISGRNYYSMKRILDELEIRGYGITINGGIIVDIDKLEIIFETYIEQKTAEFLIKWFEREEIPYVIFAGLHAYAPAKHEHHPTIEFLKTEKNNVRIYDDPKTFIKNFKVNKFMGMDCEDKLSRLKNIVNEKYGQELYIESGYSGHIEIYSKKVNKGIALAQLADKLKIPMNQVMAIGDSENDLTMLETAGLGVAMGNAFDNVKQKSDFITKDISEDGVAHAVEKFILSADIS